MTVMPVCVIHVTVSVSKLVLYIFPNTLLSIRLTVLKASSEDKASFSTSSLSGKTFLACRFGFNYVYSTQFACVL